MGRFSAGGVRLHELRQPKPANATFRQGQPPQSHSFSLGLGHLQRAIRSSCREKPTLGVIARLPCPQRSGEPEPPRRVQARTRRSRGSAPRLLPLGAHRPFARSSAAGLLPGPRRCAPRPRHIGQQPSKEALHRRPIGEPRQKPAALLGPAEALARAEDSRRQIAASIPHARDRACPNSPENGLGTGSCADASDLYRLFGHAC